MICIHVSFLGNYHLDKRMRLHYPGGSSPYRGAPNSPNFGTESEVRPSCRHQQSWLFGFIIIALPCSTVS